MNESFSYFSKQMRENRNKVVEKWLEINESKIGNYKKFMDSINSPEELLKWMKENIKYDTSNMGYNSDYQTLIKTGEELWETKKGQCVDQSYFEKNVLENLGFKCYLYHVKEEDSDMNYGPYGQSHVFVIYEDNNKYFYFEHANYINIGIHKFSSLNDCFNFIADKWLKGNKNSTKLAFREIKTPLSGINHLEFARMCYKLPIISIKYISNNNIKNSNLNKDLLYEVYPHKNESKEEFIKRFMSETKDEYPDIKQRYAVALSYWNRRAQRFR